MIIAVGLFVGLLAILFAWSMIRYYIDDKALDLYDDWTSGQKDEAADLWEIIASANRRRKRIERLLSKERRAHMSLTLTMSQHIVDLGVRVEDLLVENKMLSDNHAALFDAVLGRLLKASDTAKVTSGLV